VSNSASATITILVGAVLGRVALTGTFRRYVKGSMGPWLVIAAALLVVLGVVALVAALKKGRDDEHTDGDDPDHDHDHGHDHGPVPVAWLLLAPIVVLLLVAPPALGSFGVDRVGQVTVRRGAGTFDPLPPGPARPMTLLEFDQRAADGGASFAGGTVELTGFVVGPDSRGGFRIARYQIACCAADARAAVVRVVGATGAVPGRDRWVRVAGTFHAAADDVPEIIVTSVTEVPAPLDPYEG